MDIDDHGPMVLCALDDLLFSVRISTTAKSLGTSVFFERNPDAVVDRVREKRPSLVIVDLNSPRMRPLDLIAALRGESDVAAVTIVGFVAHADAATIDAARQAGIDTVMARSAFVEKLPALLTGA